LLAPKRQFNKELSGKLTTTTTTVSRPLLDKTPFPNRTRDPAAFQTPLPQTKLTFLDAESDNPLLFPLPSSTRKHVRVPRSASRSFETPPSTLTVPPNQWDVSELDIVLGQEQSSIVEDVLVKDDYDEVEYMPPRPVDFPFVPPFDFELPNYKELGAQILELARSYPIDDSVPSPLEADYQADFMTSPAKWSVPLPDLDPATRSATTRPARTGTVSRVLPTATANTKRMAASKIMTRPREVAPAPSASRPTRPASAPAPRQLIRTRPTSVRAPSESRLRSTTGAGVGVRSRSGTATTTRTAVAAAAGQAAQKPAQVPRLRTTSMLKSKKPGIDNPAGLFKVVADEQVLGGDFLFNV